jgi:dolichol-phosphate mannosyltransferase
MKPIKHILKEYNSNTRTKYCIGIPVLNEGEKIQKQLHKMNDLEIYKMADIFIFDGNSTDNALNDDFLKSVNVKGILIKQDFGKQGTQLRMGFDYIIKHKYQGIITIDGNNKDSIEDIGNFINKLDEGYDFIQGSRFIKGGYHENTPLSRYIAVRLIHAPWISLLSGFWFTDTTSAYRGLSTKLLTSPSLNIFRDIFIGYELLFYMSAKSPKLGYKTIEIPVKRIYPKLGKTPTKITFLGNFKIILELIKLTFNKYS